MCVCYSSEDTGWEERQQDSSQRKPSGPGSSKRERHSSSSSQHSSHSTHSTHSHSSAPGGSSSHKVRRTTPSRGSDTRDTQSHDLKQQSASTSSNPAAKNVRAVSILGFENQGELGMESGHFTSIMTFSLLYLYKKIPLLLNYFQKLG